MGFFNECSYIIRKSNKDMLIIKSEDGLNYKYLKESDYELNSDYLTLFPIDFSNYYFDIDENDNIYGIYIDNNINILKLINNKFSLINSINYDYKNYMLTFPQIKLIDNSIHIFYYLTHKNYPTTILFHHYYNGKKWIENKIDFINLPFLDNFIVYYNNNVPTIFYFKENNEFPQIYCTRFDVNNTNWDNPICLTNTLSNKIYLSVLKDKLNFYHISFCENISGKYSIRYLNGYLKNNSFDENINKFITEESLYLYPTLLKNNNSIFISFIYKNTLYTCSSNDIGNTWSKPHEDPFSINDKFIRAYFKSNYKEDKDYLCTNIFITKEPFGILGGFNS